jgi:SAM-dependent methyltransferase
VDFGEVGSYWDANAAVWTRLARDGYDVYRDFINTPALLELLPDVTGLDGLDLGCGEGHNTRLAAARGARMWGIDISRAFVREAARFEDPPVLYTVASAHQLPFRDAGFDFAIACMSFMDMPDPARVLAEAARVLKPGGFLQFSISHPCFDTPHRRQVKDAAGIAYAMEIGGYFEPCEGRLTEWIFSAAPRELTAPLRKFQAPVFHRTLAEWLNMPIEAGLRIERVAEPFASEEVAARCPKVADTRIAPYFLHVRCRKAG